MNLKKKKQPLLPFLLPLYHIYTFTFLKITIYTQNTCPNDYYITETFKVFFLNHNDYELIIKSTSVCR